METLVETLVETLAGQMYEVYCRSVGGKAFNGDPLPDWKTFRADASKKRQSDAWVNCAIHAQSFSKSME